MKKTIIFLLINLFFYKLIAQNSQIAIGLGTMNYQGDLTKSRYTFKLAQKSISLYYKKEFKYNLVARTGLTFGSVYADDKFDSALQVDRNLNFRSNITEFHMALEYHFTNLNEHKLSPYVFAGLGVFHFDPYTYLRNILKYLRYFSTEGEGLPEYPSSKPYKTTQLNIPFGVGIQYRLGDHFSLGLELTERKLFTDYLDDVSQPKYVDYTTLLNEKGPEAVQLAYRGQRAYDANNTITLNRGNPKSKDWYYTTMLTVTYHFVHDENAHRGIYECPAKF